MHIHAQTGNRWPSASCDGRTESGIWCFRRLALLPRHAIKSSAFGPAWPGCQLGGLQTAPGVAPARPNNSYPAKDMGCSCNKAHRKTQLKVFQCFCVLRNAEMSFLARRMSCNVIFLKGTLDVWSLPKIRGPNMDPNVL